MPVVIALLIISLIANVLLARKALNTYFLLLGFRTVLRIHYPSLESSLLDKIITLMEDKQTFAEASEFMTEAIAEDIQHMLHLR